MFARALWPIAVLLTVIATLLLGACAPADDAATRARDIERRILAPCCWRETLETHDSGIARGLRAEIERRSAAGERPETIEDDLAGRYGAAVRAMPRGWDPRLALGLGLGSVVALGALVLMRYASRWRSSARVIAAEVSAPRDLEYEDRLDDELLEVE